MPLVRKPPPAASTDTLHDEAKLDEKLFNGNDEERWQAARAAPEAENGLALLAQALDREKVSRVREAIFTALARVGTPASAAIVIPCLRSDDAAQRTAALDSLRAMAAAASTHLPQLLEDDDPDVRLLACEIARLLPAAEASRLLCKLLDKEENANVCSAAVEVLTESGDASVLPVLGACAARFPGDSFLTFAIKTTVSRIGSR